MLKIVNYQLGRSNIAGPVSVEADEKITTKPEDIADNFTDYF